MRSEEKEEQLMLMLEAMKIYDANNTCLSVEECAKFLNVHKNTVLNKIHSGEIKATFLGRIWRIPKLQFLDKIIGRI